MKNTIKKYLIESKQIRIYILSGKQIYQEVEKLELNDYGKHLFKEALNITALSHSLNTGKQRMSFLFSSKNGDNKISTQSFSNNTITGIITLNDLESSFKNGTLQAISSIDNQIGGSHISYSMLDYGELYKDMEQYYFSSEQTPTYFIPISDEQNIDNIVLLIQPLPFTKEKIVSDVLQKIFIHKKSMTYSSLVEIESSLPMIFSDCKFLEEINIEYSCGCSKEMFIGMIFTLSEDEIKNIISKKETLDVSCSLCGKEYIFSHEDIASYLQ
ncbi:Hsp33 family molecular chaperone HslO [Globicatella sulfidifaciens]